MKKLIAIVLVLSLFGGTVLAQKKETPKKQKEASQAQKDTLKTKKEKVSYCLGVSLGMNMKMQALDIDQGLMVQGLKELQRALANQKLMFEI